MEKKLDMNCLYVEHAINLLFYYTTKAVHNQHPGIKFHNLPPKLTHSYDKVKYSNFTLSLDWY